MAHFLYLLLFYVAKWISHFETSHYFLPSYLRFYIYVWFNYNSSEEPPPEPPGIPGYDLYLLLGVFGIISVLLFKKRAKS
ncbi:MAG: Loki-CTERM sorting domain-containing protein [Candidatus Hodarchaeales archaeon]